MNGIEDRPRQNAPSRGEQGPGEQHLNDAEAGVGDKKHAQHFSITTHDGFTLQASGYEPPGELHPKLVIINPTATVSQEFYTPFAQYLAERGLPTVTYDYRGVGRSRPTDLSGFNASISTWGRSDFASVLDWAQLHFPELRPIVIGHGVGGQIVALAENNHLISGMIGVSTQSAYWGHYAKNRGRRRLYYTTRYIIPKLVKLYGYLPSKALRLGEDLPSGVFTEWVKWCQHPDYMFSDSALNARISALGLSAPVLAVLVEDDIWAPERAVRAFMSQFQNSTVNYWRLSPYDAGLSSVGHMGLFREELRNTVWRGFADWIQAVI